MRTDGDGHGPRPDSEIVPWCARSMDPWIHEKYDWVREISWNGSGGYSGAWSNDVDQQVER
jgi:hypothetical protein